MTDTNLITQILDATRNTQQPAVAWYIITTGAGALIMHLYHTIVAAGGVKAIWRKFWNGDQSKNQS